jgi:hypothetical protein
MRLVALLILACGGRGRSKRAFAHRGFAAKPAIFLQFVKQIAKNSTVLTSESDQIAQSEGDAATAD